MKMRVRGFTLIELLIVVAIIAILAAIAVPNFLEAQIRSKVSRVKADERTYATAIEAYYVDWNTYPCPLFNADDIVGNICPLEYTTYRLSTPVSYMTTGNLPEPFNGRNGAALFEGCDILNGVTPGNGCDNSRPIYLFISNANDAFIQASMPALRALLGGLPQNNTPEAVDDSINQIIMKRWAVASPGPDTFYSYDRCTIVEGRSSAECTFQEVADMYVDRFSGVYDPTNGTVSQGEVVRTGAGLPFGGK